MGRLLLFKKDAYYRNIMAAYKNKNINIPHAHSDFQKGVMEQIEKDNVCPFCIEHFLKYHTKPIIKDGTHWILTENFEPYEGTLHHLLLVHKEHIESFEELVEEARDEFFKMWEYAKEKYNIEGATILMRWGDTNRTGGTVAHLHAQLISGGEKSNNKKENHDHAWIPHIVLSNKNNRDVV